MKKILFLLGMYYPKYSANGLCTKNVVDELIREGYEVDCICNGFKKDVKQERIDGAYLYYIKPRTFQILNKKADMTKNRGRQSFLRRTSTILSKMQLGFMSFAWPLVSPAYALRFYSKAKEIYQKKEYDIVVSVYTPFEALLAGYWMKKKFPEIKFIPYYLDALAGGWGPSFFSQARLEKHTRKWERKIDCTADLVISMHSSENYHSKTPLCSEKKRIFLDVPVMKESYICESEESFALYAGSLNFKARGLKKLLDIFCELSLQTEIKLLVAGACNETKFFDEYTEKTQGKIQYLGVLEHKDILELEKKAKYLVNLGSSNPYTIPSKIFEYMRFGKTIISTFQTNREPSIEYLDKYKNVIYIDEKESIEETVSHLLKDMQEEKKNEKIDLEEVFYYNTPKAFVSVMKGL